MSKDTTNSNEATLEAQRAEANHDHHPDRGPTGDEDERAERYQSEQSDDDKNRVGEHEREMAERGVNQKGEGRID